VLGVASAPLAEKLARALSRLDTVHALVVHGDGGVDELSLSGPNLAFDVRAGQEPRRFSIDAAELGLVRADATVLRGGDVAANVTITRAVLSGADRGPRRDVVLLNAAAALVAGDKAADMATGVALAAASIDSGRAQERLERLVAVSNAA
jgi:anthranilate phosphoribosyltransferase